MDRQISLIPLVCPRCSTRVSAEPEEVAWVCANCGQGMLLDESIGVDRQEVLYAAAIPVNETGKPYWVAEGQVRLSRNSFGRAGRSEAEATAFWSQPRLFCMPAYAAPLEQLLSEGINYLVKPPALQPGPAARFLPVTLHISDVRLAAEFLIVAVEAGRSDKLRELNFELKLSWPVLWILP